MSDLSIFPLIFIIYIYIYIYIIVLVYIYSSEHKDQNDVKSKCEITFYFKAS